MPWVTPWRLAALSFAATVSMAFCYLAGVPWPEGIGSTVAGLLIGVAVSRVIRAGER